MNNVLWCFDIALYLLIILTIICKVLGSKIVKKHFILMDICAIGGLYFLSFTMDKSDFSILCSIAHIVQIILVYFSTQKVQLSALIASYLLVYSINTILVICANCFDPLLMSTMSVIELIIHIIAFAFILFCCFNNSILHKIQTIIYIIPGRIKVLTLSSFFISAILMTLICSHPMMFSSSSWSVSVRIALIFFSLFICTTFPVLIITVLTNTYLKKQNESFESELKAQAEHYVALAESNKELRRFKHDFKNLRIGITKALTSGDCEIALEMIENGQNDFIQATDNIVKYNTGNGIADAILSEKQKKATASNTVIVFDGMIPQTGFSPTDLCVIFGNTLDNAIEACERISYGENKIISVSVNCTNGFIFISITNPVSEKVIIHNNHIETTKKDRTSHGFGLYSLRKIAKKYDGEMSITSEDHTFTISLEFCL